MALETLKNTDFIGGFYTKHIEPGMYDAQANDLSKYITINHENNSLTFQIQNGPIKEAGINGCQVDTIIETAKLIIEGLNKQFPCVENEEAILDLHSALGCLHRRKQNRETRDVEGISKP